MSGLGNLTGIYVTAKAATTLCSHGDPTYSRVFIVNSMRECMSQLIYALGGVIE
jgi:hypothetical protein